MTRVLGFILQSLFSGRNPLCQAGSARKSPWAQPFDQCGADMAELGTRLATSTSGVPRVDVVSCVIANASICEPFR